VSFKEFAKTIAPLRFEPKLAPPAKFNIATDLKPGDSIYYVYDSVKVYGVFYRYVQDPLHGVQIWARWIHPTRESEGWMSPKDVFFTASDGAY
jgi:hypothetical protein